MAEVIDLVFFRIMRENDALEQHHGGMLVAIIVGQVADAQLVVPDMRPGAPLRLRLRRERLAAADEGDAAGDCFVVAPHDVFHRRFQSQVDRVAGLQACEESVLLNLHFRQAEHHTLQPPIGAFGFGIERAATRGQPGVRQGRFHIPGLHGGAGRQRAQQKRVAPLFQLCGTGIITRRLGEFFGSGAALRGNQQKLDGNGGSAQRRRQFDQRLAVVSALVAFQGGLQGF